jgi:hypothetical protein
MQGRIMVEKYIERHTYFHGEVSYMLHQFADLVNDMADRIDEIEKENKALEDENLDMQKTIEQMREEQTEQ